MLLPIKSGCNVKIDSYESALGQVGVRVLDTITLASIAQHGSARIQDILASLLYRGLKQRPHLLYSLWSEPKDIQFIVT